MSNQNSENGNPGVRPELSRRGFLGALGGAAAGVTFAIGHAIGVAIG